MASPSNDFDAIRKALGIDNARRWDKVSPKTQIFELANGSVIYVKRSDEAGRNAWWGLRKNKVDQLAKEGVAWRAVLVNSAKRVGYVIDGDEVLEMVKTKNIVGSADYEFYEDSPELRRLRKVSFEKIRDTLRNRPAPGRAGTHWTREDDVLVLQLYTATGPSHDARDPAVREIARLVQRTPDSIAQKIANFRAIETEGKHGLPNYTVLDQKMWKEFQGRENELDLEAEKIRDNHYSKSPGLAEEQAREDKERIFGGQWIPTERFSKVRVRQQVQTFRELVLDNYDGKCAFCDMDVPQLLETSHIRKWGEDEANRLNPSNALCLCLLHHGAFDEGFLTITQDGAIRASPILEKSESATTKSMLIQMDGKEVRKANKFPPNFDLLAYHREKVFKDSE